MDSRARAALYAHEYPLLLAQLRRLVALARHDSNIALIALFGSTARCEPDDESDADLLVLLRDPRKFFDGQPVPGVRILNEAYAAADGQLCRWSFSGVATDAQASDLDRDFLSEVARDGVVLYQREGFASPRPLGALQSFDVWHARVTRLLSDLPAGATDTARNGKVGV